MNRRRNSLGCLVTGLGLVLLVCLAPILISSVYSVASTLLEEPAASRWLWGDWLSTVVDPATGEYRLLVEAPVCGVAVLTLLIVVLGVVWTLSRAWEEGAEEGEEKAFAGADAEGPYAAHEEAAEEEPGQPYGESEEEPPDAGRWPYS